MGQSTLQTYVLKIQKRQNKRSEGSNKRSIYNNQTRQKTMLALQNKHRIVDCRDCRIVGGEQKLLRRGKGDSNKYSLLSKVD
jgi:hypothetical protein